MARRKLLNSPLDSILDALDNMVEDPDAPKMALLSSGAPCVCGGNFCWAESNIGGYGYPHNCDGIRPSVEADCPHCGAPGQGLCAMTGRPLCWNCCEYHEPPFRFDSQEISEYQKKTAKRAREWMATVASYWAPRVTDEA